MQISAAGLMQQVQTAPDVRSAARDLELAESRLQVVSGRVAAEGRRGIRPNADVARALQVYQRDVERHRATYQQTLDVATRRLWQQAVNHPEADAPGPSPKVTVDGNSLLLHGVRLARNV